jgi:hypothetical protein
MIYFAVLNYKRGEINASEVAGWLAIWVGVCVVVIFPELLRTFASTFLVTRVFDLMVIGGFVLVISLVSASYMKSKRNEKKLEELVRKLSLKKK